MKFKFAQRAKEKAYDRTIGKLVIKMSLEQQVELVRRLPVPMPQKRAGILKDLPSDIKKMLNEGKTEQDVKTYYWGCEAFRKMWLSYELQEATLDVMIHDTMLETVHR